MKQYILLLVLMVMGAGINAYAEDVNPVKEGNVISGHVVEKGTENSLPYAAILIVETGQGTVSNEDGEFRFKKVPAGKYTLRVQLLGYGKHSASCVFFSPLFLPTFVASL